MEKPDDIDDQKTNQINNNRFIIDPFVDSQMEKIPAIELDEDKAYLGFIHKKKDDDFESREEIFEREGSSKEEPISYLFASTFKR